MLTLTDSKNRTGTGGAAMMVARPVAEPRSRLATTLNMSRRFSSCFILATVCASACKRFVSISQFRNKMCEQFDLVLGKLTQGSSKYLQHLDLLRNPGMPWVRQTLQAGRGRRACWGGREIHAGPCWRALRGAGSWRVRREPDAERRSGEEKCRSHKRTSEHGETAARLHRPRLCVAQGRQWGSGPRKGCKIEDGMWKTKNAHAVVSPLTWCAPEV